MVLLAGLCFSPAVFAVGLSVDSPEEVGLGEAFTVRVSGEGIEALELSWLGRSVRPLVRDGAAEALLGAGLGAEPGENRLSIIAVAEGEALRLDRTVVVREKKYPEQHLNVARRHVHLSREQLDRHYREKAKVGEVLLRTTTERYYTLPMLRPVEGNITSAFGLRRFFNGEPRKPHSGVDLRADEGTPVKAAAAGIVALAEEHYFSGNSVYVDHGQGVVSMYCHLSEIKVQAGRFVSRGQVVGLAGSTGRVTGPHLHFSLIVLGQRIDPLTLVSEKESSSKE
jgi:murein DD-endopeptidase MepM/ murein hydrolase activator NlpD